MEIICSSITILLKQNWCRQHHSWANITPRSGNAIKISDCLCLALDQLKTYWKWTSKLTKWKNKHTNIKNNATLTNQCFVLMYMWTKGIWQHIFGQCTNSKFWKWGEINTFAVPKYTSMILKCQQSMDQ